MGWGFADKVRKILIEMGKGGREVSAADLSIQLDLISDAEKRPLYAALRDFVKYGELERVRIGVYRYVGKGRPLPEKRQIMWRLLRARRVVSVSDLQELAGASEVYAHEWLRMLVRRGIVKEIAADKFRIINDPVVMPENKEKAEQIRKLRERNKRALEAIKVANTAMAEAMAALEDQKEEVTDDDSI